MRIANGALAAAALSSVGWLLAAGSRAPAQDPAGELPPPTLTVTGDAEVSARPDLAVVELGATAQAQQATAAQGQVNETMQRAISALTDAGVPRPNIRTSGISLQPVYSQPPRGQQGAEDQTPRIVAYRASNTVRVQVDDVSAVGDVIDAGVGVGANQLAGLSFELRDETPQRLQALREAVATAQRKAEALAEAAGVRLTSVQAIEEGGVQIASPMDRRARAMSFEAGAPVEPGQVRVDASVTLEYRIAPREGGGGGSPR